MLLCGPAQWAGSGVKSHVGFPEDHDQRMSNCVLCLRQRCMSQSSRTTWYLKVARGSCSLLKHVTKLAHEKTEQSGRQSLIMS